MSYFLAFDSADTCYRQADNSCLDIVNPRRHSFCFLKNEKLGEMVDLLTSMKLD